jgi:hypothetical protein
MSDPKPFDPFDPISAAMGAMHSQNLLAAEEAKRKAIIYAGNELARVLDDIMQSELCQFDAISKACCIATIAKWKSAKTGQL